MAFSTQKKLSLNCLSIHLIQKPCSDLYLGRFPEELCWPMSSTMGSQCTKRGRTFWEDPKGELEIKLLPNNCVACEGRQIPVNLNLVHFRVKLFPRGTLISPFTMYVTPWHKTCLKAKSWGHLQWNCIRFMLLKPKGEMVVIPVFPDDV